MSTLARPVDPFAAELALRAPGILADFNRAGVITAADVHVALRLGRLGGALGDGAVLLGVALAVRAPRTGHVFADLATAAATVGLSGEAGEADLAALPWPPVTEWVAAVSACTELVALGDQDDERVRPLRLIGTRLLLDRYWREERAVAAALEELAAGGIRPTRVDALANGIARLFPHPEDELQRVAAATAVLRGVSVIAGGPGTGKTTTVARVAALLMEQAEASAQPPPLIALCAPTGKAAARLEEAVHAEAERMAVSDAIRAELRELRASTIHRLLGWRPGSRSRFRHDSGNRLAHDIVIVDETSMVGLSLMERLLDAIRGDARVVLVGDPDQLSAIEAGAVLRDIVGPAALGPRMSGGSHALLERVTGVRLATAPSGANRSGFGDGVVVLERGRRFGAEIGALAGAIRRGDGDGALAAIAAAGDSIRWIAFDAGQDAGSSEGLHPLEPLRAASVASGAEVVAAARAGEGAAALRAISAFRLLCAHRGGPYGVGRWAAQVERWLVEALDGLELGEHDYPGRPLLITENDYELGLFNGDIGVILRSGEQRLVAGFERNDEVIAFAPSRLESAETLHAMTIHKSQGSQFDTAAVLLPDPSSRILTRELLYTAVTRARRRLILIGSEESLQSAIERPVARATGLRERLWPG